MKKLLISAFLAAGSVSVLDSASAHGGKYRGPGDIVPPGGGGGGGGGGAPSSGSPGVAGPTGSSVPGATSPGAPVGTPGASAGAVTAGGGDSGPDLTIWQYWWGFNKEPYINLKAAVHSGAVQTGSDDFFLGMGEKGQARDSLAPTEAVVRSKIVPALKTALRNERQDDILDSCLIALAKIGDAEAEDGSEPMAEDIKKFLSHPSQQLSETAAVSLGILANDSLGERRHPARPVPGRRRRPAQHLRRADHRHDPAAHARLRRLRPGPDRLPGGRRDPRADQPGAGQAARRRGQAARDARHPGRLGDRDGLDPAALRPRGGGHRDR